MNVKELAEQANDRFEEHWPGGCIWYWDELAIFAELVAAQVYKECADIARDVANATEPDDWALHKCNEIKHAILTRSKA